MVMEHMEMIDKLMDKAGVSRSEAADALRRAEWDMLEALVILEREGKIPPLTSSVSTPQGSGYESPRAAHPAGIPGGNRTYRSDESLGDKLRKLFESSLSHSLYVRRGGRVIISLPVLVFVIVLAAAFRLSAAALLIGIFAGCRYSIEKRGEGEK